MPQLAVGDVAPDFTLPTADGGKVTLSALRGQRVVIFFFPAAMTPGCTLEASDFQSVSPDLTDAGYQVIGISPDPVAKLARVRRDGEPHLPARRRTSTATVLRAYGAWGEKKLYGKVLEGVLRSTVVVGRGRPGRASRSTTSRPPVTSAACGGCSTSADGSALPSRAPTAAGRRCARRRGAPCPRLTREREWRNWQPRQV